MCGAQKKPLVKKRPYQKNDSRKNLSIKVYIFLTDKLNMIDLISLIFLNSYLLMNHELSLLQNSLMGVRFQLYCTFCLYFTLIISLKASHKFVCFILCCLFLTQFFTLFLKKIVRFDYLDIIKPLSYNTD